MREKLVSDVAAELSLTPGRIRQLCGEYRLGRMLHNRLRVLAPQEVAKIRQIVKDSKPGPKPGKKKKPD